MLFKSLALAGLASLVTADLATILASLSVIDADTNKLNTDLSAFNGNIIFAVPILGDNLQLNSDLVNGTSAINNSGGANSLSVNDAVELLAPVQKLSNDVNVTVTNLISKYQAFKSDDLTGIVLVTLEATKTDADNYSNAIINQVPASLQDTARSVAAPIEASFAQAIAVYQN